MRIRELLLVVVWCTLTVVASAQEVKIVVGGEARDIQALTTLREVAQTALAALPASEEEEIKTRRADLEAEIRALADAVSLLEKLRSYQTRKSELTAESEQVKGELTTARATSQEPITFTTMSEEQLGELDREAAARKQEVTQAEAGAADLKARFEKRRDGLDALAQTIETSTAALGAAREARESETAVERHPDLDRRVRTAEARLRIAEVNRDQHASLLELQSLAADVARTRSELARLRQARADAVVAAARTVREQELAREAEAARKAAEAKRREAELANSPTEKAIANLSALVQQLNGEAAEDRTTASRIRTWMGQAERDLDWARKELVLVKRLFPDGAKLDDWKVKTLGEETTKVARRRKAIEAARSALASPDVILRSVISLRDRLESLRALIERTRNGGGEALPDQAFENYQQVWLDAMRGFNAGLPQLTPAEVARYGTQLAEQTDLLVAAIEQRLPTLEAMETSATRMTEVSTERDQALQAVSRHLESVSLWLRADPPLGDKELTAAGEELRQVGRNLLDTPGILRREWRHTGFSPTLLGFLVIAVLLAFMFGLRLTRRLRAERRAESYFDGLDSLQRLQRIVSVSLGRGIGPAALALAALALERAEPGRPLIVTIACLAAAWAVSAFLRGANGALYEVDGSGERLSECEDGTAVRARRLGSVVANFAPALLAVSLALDTGGFPKLAVLARIASIALLLGVALWLVVFGRDVLALISPREGGGPFRRAMRAILPIVWPLAFAFFAGVFVLLILGYRNAAWFYGSRSLLCAGAFLAAFLAYQILWAVAARRLGVKDEDDGELDVQQGRVVRSSDLYRRLTRALILLAVFIGVGVALSMILEFDEHQWGEIGGQVIIPGFGTGEGLTLGEILKAVLIFWIALAIARFVRDLLKLVLAERTGTGAGYVIRTLTFYLVAAFGVGFSLAALGLQLERIGWFFTAATVGLGFGLQEVVSNFVAGLILFFERPVQVGDVITVGEVEGDVIRINIRSTVVRTRDGISIIIPNKRLIMDDVVNWSHGDQRTRLRIQVSVAYGSDIPLVKKLLLDIATKDSRILSRPRPEVDFMAFGESELQFNLLAWLPHPDITLRRRVRSEVNSAVDAAFREHGVVIPFPQRDLHLKSTPRSGAEDVLTDETEGTEGTEGTQA